MFYHTLVHIGIFLLCSNAFSKVVTLKDPSFEISQEMMNSKNIYFSFEQYKRNSFYKSDLADFDVEGFSRLRNSRMFFSKGFFVIDKPIEDIDKNIFFDTKTIGKIMGATSIRKDEKFQNTWRSEIPVMVLSIRSKLEVKLLDEATVENDTYGDYYRVAENFDLNSLSSKYQVHMRVTDFSMGFDKMIIVSKFIPLGKQTAVVGYVLVRAHNKWWKKRNVLGAATKTARKMMLKVLKNTERYLQ